MPYTDAKWLNQIEKQLKFLDRQSATDLMVSQDKSHITRVS